MPPDDASLIRETLAGRTESFGALICRYQGRLYNALFRMLGDPDEAEDIAQEAFLNAYRSLERFRGGSGFYTWLYRIAFNSALTARRKRPTRLTLDSGEGGPRHEPTDESDGSRPGSAMERAEEVGRVLAALERLTPEHRAVLVLKEIEGLRYDQIAEIVGVPIGTVRSRLHRARLEMKEILERNPADA